MKGDRMNTSRTMRNMYSPNITLEGSALRDSTNLQATPSQFRTRTSRPPGHLDPNICESVQDGVSSRKIKPLPEDWSGPLGSNQFVAESVGFALDMSVLCS